MPLYERTARPFCITDVVKAVWRSQNEPEILCKQHPMRVTYNGFLLIDLKHVPLKDLVAGGNGVFTNTGQPTHTIKISSNENEGESEDEDEKSPQVTVLARAKCPLKSSSEFLLQRYYYRHSKKTTFHRRICVKKKRKSNPWQCGRFTVPVGRRGGGGEVGTPWKFQKEQHSFYCYQVFRQAKT